MHKIAHWFEKYEKHVGVALLVGGFIFDNLFLIRPDNFRDNISFISFLSASAIAIILVNVFKKGIGHTISFFVMQFGLGGLFSMSLVFYSRGATFGANWPFLLLLASYLVGNELFKKRYALLISQIGAFFIALFSYLIFVTPVIIHRMDGWAFAISGVASLVVISAFIFIVLVVNPREVWKSRRGIVLTVMGIFAAINILYFTNLIPPIPLLLKDAGVYHSVVRSGSTYVVALEPPASGLSKYFSYFITPTIHIVGSKPVYVFSSVFAPVDLNANLKHVWQHYDPKQKKWIVESTVSIPIIGGRVNGYRIYSLKSDLDAGEWRVDVETARGQIIGRVKFNVEKIDTAPELTTENK
jgi:hypothetical protein